MAIGGFVYQGSPQRVVFGSGTLRQVGDEVALLGIKQALVLSTPEQKDQAEAVSALRRAAERATHA